MIKNSEIKQISYLDQLIQAVPAITSSFPTRFLPLTVSVIVRVRGNLVRLELEETCWS